MSDDNFGLNWKILQMKVYNEFNFSKCAFDDGPVNTLPIMTIPIPPPIMSPRQPNIEHVIASYVPSVADLLNIKNNLKTIKKMDNKPVIKKPIKNKQNNVKIQTIVLDD